MSIFRFFGSQRCPQCGNRFSKDANFCNHCGFGNQNGWRRCSECGEEVGAESNFCWNCSADLQAQAFDKTRGGIWKREPGEIAVRFPLQFPGKVVEKGVEVPDGTKGLLYVNGVFNRELSQGFGEQKPNRSLIDRLFFLEGGNDRVQAVLVPVDAFDVPVQMHHPIELQSGGKLQASLLLSLRISDESKLFSRLLLARDLVTVAHLEDELLTYCSRALGFQVGQMTEDSILERRYDVEFFEEPIRKALEGVLGDLGLEFIALRDINVLGNSLDEAMKRNAQQRLREEGLARQFEELQSEAAFQKFKEALAHESKLSEMELRETELLFQARTARKLRELERPDEIEEAKHREEIRKIRHHSHQEILEELRASQRKALEELLPLKQKKDRMAREHEHEREMNRAKVQIHLARSIDGLSREAILASAGREVRADLVSLAQAEVGRDLSNRFPMPASELEVRKGTGQGAAPPIVPTRLETRRKAVGLLYAAFGEEILTCLGTVWALDRKLAVTNAHVAVKAMSYLDIENGFGVWARFPDPHGQAIPISRLRIHPRFADHQARVEGKEHAVPGCDLAVLELDAETPYTLNCLSKSRLKHLEVGQPINYIGFPAEGIPGGGSNPSAPSPLYKPGTISNLTDFSYASVPAEAAQLITFDAGVAGGASGSPLMNEQGDVVGVVSAGTMHSLKGQDGAYPDEHFERIASGALVNFAQRIDLLDELL